MQHVSIYGLVSRTLFASVAALFLSICAIGILNNYTPAPFWDMWDGNILFYTRILDNDMSAWWGQHVSHRTVFSNALFFVDHSVFGGTYKFLLFSHYLLMGLAAYWVYTVLRKSGVSMRDRWQDFAFVMVIICILFSWIQSRNITWAFQSQMFAATLFPASAMLMMYVSFTSQDNERKSLLWFTLSLVMGFCSAYTMMNGIAALPILVLMAVALRMPPRRIVSVFALSLFNLWLFFRGYSSPEGQGSYSETLLERPLEVFQFALMHLGAPIHYILFESASSKWIAVGTGLLMVVGFAWMLYLLLRNETSRAFGIFWGAVLLYLAATVGGIAAGRLVHGLEQAFESRYMTNALFVWAVFATMLWILARGVILRHGWVFWAVLILPLSLLPYQLNALKRDLNPRFGMMEGVLALELGVRDAKQIEYVWPWMDVAFILAARAKELDVGVFGVPLYKGLAETIGQPSLDVVAAASSQLSPCSLSSLSLEMVPDDEKYTKLKGLLQSSDPMRLPSRFAILTPDLTTIGYAVTDRSVYLPFRKASPATWVAGYFLADDLPETIILRSERLSCRFDIDGHTERVDSPE